MAFRKFGKGIHKLCDSIQLYVLIPNHHTITRDQDTSSWQKNPKVTIV
jgi:hypothetical protein